MSDPTNEIGPSEQGPLSTFREQLERAAERAHRGCGLSDRLYVERIYAEVAGMLEHVPAEMREAAKEIAFEYGYYEGEEEPYHEPATCFLTGIDEHCSPADVIPDVGRSHASRLRVARPSAAQLPAISTSISSRTGWWLHLH